MLLKLWPWVGGAALGLLIAGPLLAYSQIARPLTGFLVFAASLLPALVAIVIGVLLLAGIGGERHVASGVAALIFGLVPLAVIAPGLAKGGKVPRINDVTTDLEDPPALTVAAQDPDLAGKDLTFPVAFKDEVRRGYPSLAPLTISASSTEAFAKVETALGKIEGVTITRRDTEAGVIEGKAVTGLFKFVDDFAVRLQPQGGGTLIDMRSRSRVGQGDFGANAARIEAVFGQLKQ
jgi:uncharacterized protein (DUF1499 family)